MGKDKCLFFSPVFPCHYAQIGVLVGAGAGCPPPLPSKRLHTTVSLHL